ncbi:MAG: hypothetical protein V4510_05285 [bacterium]
MHEQLKDLRLLYLAHQLEDSFEGLERAFERRIPPGPIRESLQPVFQGGPGHAALTAALGRLNADVKAREVLLTPLDLLQAMLDCERMAQGFYLGRKDDLADPALRDLFVKLAAEEGRHVQVVEKAMAMLAATKGG